MVELILTVHRLHYQATEVFVDGRLKIDASRPKTLQADEDQASRKV